MIFVKIKICREESKLKCIVFRNS